MNADRRGQQRFLLSIPAKISCRHTLESPPVVDTVTANISSGGAFFQTEHHFPLAAKVQVEFNLRLSELKELKFLLSADSLKKLRGDRLWVKATGVIIRHEENGVGIIFDTDYQFTPLAASETLA
jgi:hypothetical protein